MPKTKRAKPLYTRGEHNEYRLYAVTRPGRKPYEIVWYDKDRQRERVVSPGTRDLGEAKRALDRLYLEAGGETLCPTCGQPTHSRSPRVTDAINDYLVTRQSKPGYGSIAARLAHVVDYIEATGGDALICQQIDEQWVERFREWLKAKPRYSTAGKLLGPRALSTIENSVLQLRAAINYADKRGARFASIPTTVVNRTPTYRADTATIAKMFAYAMEPKKRREVLWSFLRFSVLTLCRPDAAFDASTEKKLGQWDPQHEVFNLNPRGRRPSRIKNRAVVPIVKPGAAWLNSFSGPVVEADTIKTAWNAMAKELGLPMGDGESGPKLIRRSMAVIVTRKMLINHRSELEAFLGHSPGKKVTAIYAPIEPDYLKNAKRAVASAVNDIEKLAPGAFTAILPRKADRVPPKGEVKSSFSAGLNGGRRKD